MYLNEIFFSFCLIYTDCLLKHGVCYGCSGLEHTHTGERSVFNRPWRASNLRLLSRWFIDMEGAPGTLYEGEKFQLLFKFSSRYPFDSPQVNLGSARVHSVFTSSSALHLNPCPSVSYRSCLPARTFRSIRTSTATDTSVCPF